jgi:copper homeostasis protein
MTWSQAMTADRILLEVCVDTPAGLAAAIAGGADRIELCAALALQGLTPAPGLMAQAASAPIPIYPMIRPRNGDFTYDAGDLDAHPAGHRRCARIRPGRRGDRRQPPDGQLDLDVLEMLVEHSKGLGMSLHRSFDLVPDQSAALEAAIELGFERVLTSGGALTAQAGAERIAELVQQADGRIGILAGAGVKPQNVAELVEADRRARSARLVQRAGPGGGSALETWRDGVRTAAANHA